MVFKFSKASYYDCPSVKSSKRISWRLKVNSRHKLSQAQSARAKYKTSLCDGFIQGAWFTYKISVLECNFIVTIRWIPLLFVSMRNINWLTAANWITVGCIVVVHCKQVSYWTRCLTKKKTLGIRCLSYIQTYTHQRKYHIPLSKCK